LDLSDGQRSLLTELRQSDLVLAGRKVLVVDDDLRNIFALSSLLEEHHIHVIHAENGRAGVELLRQNPDIDAVLMDIMMPEMDGYETMRAIRQIPQFRNLPIVALTAKAMKGDREKCLEAGASDYVTKPVDLEQLFSVLRVWISSGADPAPGSEALASAGEAGSGSALSRRRSAAIPSDPGIDVLDDDRHSIEPGDPVLLIVEDDPTFARILVEIAHERKLKAVVALRGNTALSLAREFKPEAVTLDIGLPDMMGWTILDRLKHDPLTRHIPVHIISGDEDRRRGLALGAMTYLEKSVSREGLARAFGVIGESANRRIRKLLVVSDSPAECEVIRTTIAGNDIEVLEATGISEALTTVGQQYLDALAVSYRLESGTAAQLIQELQKRITPYTPPVILYGQGLTDADAHEIGRLSRTSTVRYAPSLERLLEETALLLHRADTDLSDVQRRILDALRQNDRALAGRKVLVVDDDLRNIFALSSVLEEHNLKVIHAENGRAGIEALQEQADIDAVLMDIMMPEMDGLETMRAIRQIPAFRELPIVALTAKAMKGDREKCLEAGATDYITKPVDLEHLFSVLRVWINKADQSGRLTAFN
jgi:CheY-like chemotaxis protein